MGLIEDGTVSGVLPCGEGFAIHYPGYPSSISRAMDTLGGIQGIHKARSSESKKLELHFRPEDPYSHPAFGELRPCNNLLLKISKKKDAHDHRAKVSNSMSMPPVVDTYRLESVIEATQVEKERGAAANKVDDYTAVDGETKLYADIIAHVPEAYCFDGMVDYQHVVSVHADVAQKKKRNWSEAEEPHFEKGGLMDVDHEDVMLLLPPIFSPKDVPENIVLRVPSTLSSRKKQGGLVGSNLEIEKEQVLAIDFDIAEIPKIVNWEEYIPQGSDEWNSQLDVSRLFDERPIWCKDSLTERLLDKGLDFTHEMLRRLLSRIAYYFSSGPFLRFWIKKGYDPRKDPDSRMVGKFVLCYYKVAERMEDI